MFSLSEKALKKCIVGYCIFPIMIFMIGWLKFYLAIFIIGALFLGYFFWKKQLNSATEIITINYMQLFIIVFSCACIVVITGIGGYFSQVIDFSWRNALFRDLVEYSWPVYYDKIDCALCYYIAYWLPAALVGKVLGYEFASFALFIWTVIGLLLLTLLLIFRLKVKKTSESVLILLILVSFGVLEFFGGLIFDVLFKEYHFSYMNPLNSVAHVVFINNYSAMTFLYNQTFVPWLVILMIINEHKTENLAFYGLLAFPYGPFPFLIIFIYAVAYGIDNMIVAKNIKIFLKSFSVQNVVMIATVLPIFALYFMSASKMSVTPQKNNGMVSWYFENYSSDTILYVCAYYIIVFGIYFAVLYKRNRKSMLYWLTVILLVAIPHISLSSTANADLASHAGVILIFILMYLFMREIFEKDVQLRKKYYVTLAVILTLSTLDFWGTIWFPLHNIKITQTISAVSDYIYTLGDKCDEISFYAVHPENNSLFFKYLSRP